MGHASHLHLPNSRQGRREKRRVRSLMLGISYKDFVPHSTELAPPHHLWWSPPPINRGRAPYGTDSWGIFYFLYLCLSTSNQAVGLICQRCGKPIVRTAFAEFETLAQVCHGGGEIAHGEVCLRRVGTEGLEFALSESASTLYAERTSGKVGMKCVIRSFPILR